MGRGPGADVAVTTRQGPADVRLFGRWPGLADADDFFAFDPRLGDGASIS
jgi:hypothetical protein